MIEEKVLEIATSLGFAARLSEENYWQILSLKPSENWMLTYMESRWILSVKNVPQIRLNEREAIAFLTSRSQVENKD